jgi:hypothetical protein
MVSHVARRVLDHVEPGFAGAGAQRRSDGYDVIAAGRHIVEGPESLETARSHDGAERLFQSGFAKVRLALVGKIDDVAAHLDSEHLMAGASESHGKGKADITKAHDCYRILIHQPAFLAQRYHAADSSSRRASYGEIPSIRQLVVT